MVEISLFSTVESKYAAVHVGGYHVLLILHALFDEAELENSQSHDHDHQYHRLRCRSAQIKRLEAIVINLIISL